MFTTPEEVLAFIQEEGVKFVDIGAGNTEGEVSVRKLSGKLQRMKPVLTKEEVSAVNKRLKSLGGIKAPIPQGMDPSRAARPSRKAMRGR